MAMIEDKCFGKSYRFNFPEIGDKGTPFSAMRKIEEEVDELKRETGLWDTPSCEGAALDPYGMRAVMELLDVIHACETMLRMYDKEIVDCASWLVFEKNMDRGYYREPDAEA